MCSNSGAIVVSHLMRDRKLTAWISSGHNTGKFASSPLDVSPSRCFASGRTQRFLVTLYILSFIILKLRLTTFNKANDDDDEDPAYSVKIQALGAKRLGGETSRGELTKGGNVHKPKEACLAKR